MLAELVSNSHKPLTIFMADLTDIDICHYILHNVAFMDRNGEGDEDDFTDTVS